MFLRYILLFVVLIGFNPVAWGRVRLIQWTDVHSSLETMSRQVYAIDQMAREFKAKHPDGEVVVYIIGDFTSINVYVDDEGWFSIEAMKLLRERGYTVLFTPGNHDAFDWVSKPGDIQLFIDQMKKIKSWGVKILAENFTGRTPLLDSLLTFSYHLETVEPMTHIVGLTLEGLIGHSNLYEEEARILFSGVENYNQTLRRILPEMSHQGVKTVILGVHTGHFGVVPIAQDSDLVKISGIRIPLMMAAHDHLVASYKVGGTLISDAGSYGSFNVIDISEKGEVSENIQHVAISSKILRYSDGKDIFHYGVARDNGVTRSDVENSWLNEYEQKIRAALSRAKTQLDPAARALEIASFFTGETKRNRVVMTLENDVDEAKIHMQHGRSLLGDMVAETLAHWVRSVFPGAKGQAVIAMFNSSAYRMEEPISKGPITDLTIREMYPYKAEASFYMLKGEVIENLYFALRKDYALRSKNGSRYSPQVNPEVREFSDQLQIRVGKDWVNINKNKIYLVAFGPWLSQHRFGQSYRIEEWLKALNGKEPLASMGFQEILVEFFPGILKANDERVSQLKASVESDSCHDFFESGDQTLKHK